MSATSSNKIYGKATQLEVEDRQLYLILKTVGKKYNLKVFLIIYFQLIQLTLIDFF